LVGADDVVKIEKMELSSSFAGIEGTGTLEAMNYKAGIDLVKMESEIGKLIDLGGYRFGGMLDSAGEVGIGEELVTAKGELSLKEFVLTDKSGKSFSQGQVKVNFDAVSDSKKGALFLRSLSADIDAGSVDISNAVVPMGADSGEKFKADASAAIDLGKLKDVLVFTGAIPGEMGLIGAVNSKVAVNESGNEIRIFTDSTRIDGLRIDYPGKKPFEQSRVDIVLDAKFNLADGSKSVDRFEVVSPTFKVKGKLSQKASGNNVRLEGSGEASYDLSDLSVIAGDVLPEGFEVTGKRNDAISFASEYPANDPGKMLANMSGGTAFGFDSASYMGMNFGKTDVKLKISNGVLEISPFSTQVNNGRFNFAGRADLNREPVLLELPGRVKMIDGIDINDETTSKLLKYVNPVFAGAVNVSGVANFDCEKLSLPLDGSKRELVVIGTIDINDINLSASDLLGQIISISGGGKGEQLEILPTRFVLRDEVLSYDDMQMNIGDKPVNFSGRIGLDKRMSMNIKLPITLEGRTARVGGDSGDRVLLPLVGTVDKPKIDTGKLIESQIEQQLKKGLEGLFK